MHDYLQGLGNKWQIKMTFKLTQEDRNKIKHIVILSKKIKYLKSDNQPEMTLARKMIFLRIRVSLFAGYRYEPE